MGPAVRSSASSSVKSSWPTSDDGTDHDGTDHHGSMLSRAPTRNASTDSLADLETFQRRDVFVGKQRDLARSLSNRLHALCIASPFAALSQQQAALASRGLTRAEREDLHTLFALVCHTAGKENSSLRRSSDPSPSEQRSGSREMRLHWGEFQQALGVAWNAPIVKRVFDLLRPDGQGSVSFESFARGLFPICSTRARLRDKLRFVFSVIDLDGSNSISKPELHCALRLAFAHRRSLPTQLLEQVLDATFALFQLDLVGEISWGAFERYYHKHPEQAQVLIQPLGFNINRLTASIWLGLPEQWLLPERTHAPPSAPVVVLERGYTPPSMPKLPSR